MTSQLNDITKFGSMKDDEAQTFPIIWDSGASVCVTNDKSDFTTFTSKSSIPVLQGYAKGHKEQVQGQGHVSWAIADESSTLRTLQLPAYYLPKAKLQLLSTSVFMTQYHEKQNENKNIVF